MGSALDSRPEEIKKFVLDNPLKTQQELANSLGISMSSLCRFLKRHKIERSEVKRSKIPRDNKRKCFCCGLLIWEHDCCKICSIPLHDTAFFCPTEDCDIDHWSRVGTTCRFCFEHEPTVTRVNINFALEEKILEEKYGIPYETYCAREVAGRKRHA